MSSESASELHLRSQSKKVLKLLEETNTEEARAVILENKEILRYNFGLVNFVPLIPRIRFSKRIPKSYDALKMLIEAGFEIFSKEGNINELLFFAAAKCDVETLNYCVSKILEENPDSINQTREGDTALMFMIKYTNISDENFPKCVKILIDAGVNVNKSDYFSHIPYKFLTDLYKRHTSKTNKNEIVIANLKKSIELLEETGKIDMENLKAVEEKEQKMLPKTLHHDDSAKNDTVTPLPDTLFKYLIKDDEENFEKCDKIVEFINADDGTNTLLQLCCERKLVKAAKLLIKKGADLSKITERNKKTPLEIAARRNCEEIFKALLETGQISIDKSLFITFLQNRPRHIKAKYFDDILKYKHLDVNITSNNGNTPLHYAIIFSSTEAIEVLLKRGASLTVQNDSQKSPLDYINSEDLENYLDKCIIPDSHKDINNGRYEIALNYQNLIESESELLIIQKICNSPKLCHLVNHPLIASFIDIKWKLAEPLYKKLFIFQLLFYLTTTLFYINLNLFSWFVGSFLALIYFSRTYIFGNWKNNKLHSIVDFMISFIIMLSIFTGKDAIKYQLGIIVTIFMAFSFHLFLRFNPKFSEFHAILVNIMSHIFSYLFYALIITLFFGAGSYIYCLLQLNEEINSSVNNYENVLYNVKMIFSNFYFISTFGTFIFTMIIMTIINSFIYLQENFSENIKNNFKISGYKDILIFLDSVEKLPLTIDCKMIQIPLIFDNDVSDTDDGKSNDKIKNKKKEKREKRKNKFLLNFFVNTNKFSHEKLISITLDDTNVNKIKKILKKELN